MAATAYSLMPPPTISIFHGFIRMRRVRSSLFKSCNHRLGTQTFNLLADVGAYECKEKGCNARFHHDSQLKQHAVQQHNTDMTAYDNKGQVIIEEAKADEIFFGHTDKFVPTANGSMPDLNLTDSFMPEILNDVCNEVTIYTDL